MTSSDNPDDFLSISAGDKLIIPGKTNSVFVYGEVIEGAITFVPDEGVDYFVEKSGGYKDLQIMSLSIYYIKW